LAAGFAGSGHRCCPEGGRVTSDRVGSLRALSVGIRKHWQLYLIILLPVIYIVIFKYLPMHGVTLAFKDYQVRKGILGSPWIGFKYVTMFVTAPSFWRLIWNTLSLSVYYLAARFPIPIILAISLEQIHLVPFKKLVQTVTYAPFFISTVVMVSMIIQFTAPRSGIVNFLIVRLGGREADWMASAEYFQSIYVWSGIWQYTGFNSIIYLAALSAVDPQLHEAAVIDGATRMRRIWHVDLPGIKPTIVILLIMNLGQIMNVGFEKVFLMQNAMNLSTSEILTTYVYKVGLVNMNYSFSTAVSLFNSVINCALIIAANWVARTMGESSLW
jgi:putative aldouronate transport system permease protein